MNTQHKNIVDDAHSYTTAPMLVDALAPEVAHTLSQAVHQRGQASLVVSGGRTPIPLFKALAAQDAPWSAISITLADERWVPTDSAQSNEHMVREHLLQGPAAAAHFVGLYNHADTPANGEAACADALADLPRPFDVVILGMGDDGHTASLFPGSPELEAALATNRPCAAMSADKRPRERMTLTPAALLDSRRIIVHIAGADKWSMLQTAAAPGAIEQYPVRAVLHQQQVPVEVHWSP